MLAKLLVANRGEIAVRTMGTAADLDIATVAIHPADDAGSQHVRMADASVELAGAGPSAYLDIEAVVAVAVAAGADAVHPGYGLLAENVAFAAACEDAGLIFVGPTSSSLGLFGDKAAARAHAVACGVPVLEGTSGPTSLAEAKVFLNGLGDGGAVMVKALAGGGGRGMRPATSTAELADAFERCTSEAHHAFGNGDLYVEQLLVGARHIEVQIVGDGQGEVVVLGERECSIQRQRQKILEVAPAPGLSDQIRSVLHGHAAAMASAASYRSLITMEFLVAGDDVAFLEGNARIQVEHTVTEEILGVDLVATQLAIASGDTSLDHLAVAPRGVAVQARLNLERIDPEGSVWPSGGRLDTFVMPSGPGVRVDTYGAAGYVTNPRYDSLIAKVIAHAPSPDPSVALRRLHRALSETTITGADTTLGLLGAIALDPAVASGTIHTTWLEENLPRLLDVVAEPEPQAEHGDARAGVRLDDVNLLAVIDLGRDALVESGSSVDTPETASAPGTLSAPLQGTVVSIDVVVGDEVAAGQQVVVMEAMKMEHVISADDDGIIRAVSVEVGAAVFEGHALLVVEPAEVSVAAALEHAVVDLDHIREDLAESIERHEIGLDHRRPKAVDKRRRTNQRTARENLEHLVDPGSYIEYGPLAIAPPTPTIGRGPNREHACRRDDRGHRQGQRRPVRRRQVPLRGHVLRLHRACRHPRRTESPKEGSPVRVGTRMAAPGDFLHRRWRRATWGHRGHGGLRA